MCTLFCIEHTSLRVFQLPGFLIKHMVEPLAMNEYEYEYSSTENIINTDVGLTPVARVGMRSLKRADRCVKMYEV